ncbi:MAG: ATP-binding protein, partial [Planctomycetes bacterium]|nr:ATP-binding protein [Planctomycetota bacterium]
YSTGNGVLLGQLYPKGITRVIRYLPPPSIVAAMLVLVTIFFIVSYLAARTGHHHFALRQRMTEAERAVERYGAISTMAAGLAHEIRNPLASLRSAIQELGESFPNDSQNRILTDVIIAESDRLDRIIGRFLDFSLESQLRLSRQPLAEILQEVQNLVLHREDSSGLRIELRIRNDPKVECDADRLKEVFLNLALNAVQATPSRQGELIITLAAVGRKNVPGVEILFVDNGPGIEEKNLVRLFEPFFTSKANGTGLGLPLSRKQVNLHGGVLDAGNNTSGRGAWFRVWLPLKQIGK